MSRVVVAVLALMGLHGVASAQRFGVGSTQPGDPAIELVKSMLPDAASSLGAGPASFEPEDFLPWSREQGVEVAIVIDRPTQRVYVAMGLENRVLERVLPGEAEDYVIALTASELAELGMDPPAAAMNPDDEGDDADDAIDSEDTPEAPEAEGARDSYLLHVGALGWSGLPGDLWAISGELGMLRLRGRLVVGARLFGGGATRLELPSIAPDFEVTYRRMGGRAEVGALLLDRSRLMLLATGTVGLEWVAVRASGTFAGTVQRGGDDRAAAVLGTHIEGLIPFGRWVVGVGAGVDWLIGATPYVAYGRPAFDEPRARASADVIFGMTF